MDKNNAHHILVIRLSAMGDVAMTVPVILGLIQQHPEIKITVLTKAFLRPIFLQIPQVTVYVADVQNRHKGVAGLYKLYKELKALDISHVADLHNVLRSNVLKLFFRLGRCQFVQIDKGRSEKKALIAGPIKNLKPLKTSHQRYADVFEKLGYKIDLNKVSLLPKFSISSDVKKQLKFNVKPLLGIAPYAAFQGKTYPAFLMDEVLNKLNNTNKFQILLFGGGKKEIEQLTHRETSFSNVFSVAGKFSLEEELQLISNLDLMLSMDSGNGHLAANYDIPVITIWGITHPCAGFAPFNQPIENAIVSDREQYPLIPTSIYGNKMPEGYEKVMETITTESIVAIIDNALSK